MKQTSLKIWIATLLLFICSTSIAQNGRNLERIRTMKIAFISDRLNLSPAQAELFWPVYNNYEADLKEIRQHFRQEKNNSTQNINDEVARRQLDDNLDLQENMIDLRKKYKNEFLKVISPTQLLDLFNAEKDFRQILMKELQNRRERNGNARPMRGGDRRMYRY